MDCGRKPWTGSMRRRHNFLSWSKFSKVLLTYSIKVDSIQELTQYFIDRTDGFTTSVYRKPSLTGFTNFDSFIPLSFKRGLVYTLLDRYFKICSSYHLFHSEILKLKKILLSNGYPEVFLDRCIRVFLDRLFCPPLHDRNVSHMNQWIEWFIFISKRFISTELW